ncbi:hypothetical protein [Mycobacterium sp. NPDC050041]|uniref:hypothetical protein n=1 Tax=Mycobacterium sp. NPDC050041 TaxID=3364293 RepID=UPI003C2B2843
MSDTRSLADFVRIAMKRRNALSGRRLSEIAAADGYDISHSTINRIRRGDYSSEPTTSVLKAIAHLAGEPESAVFAAAAARTREWGEYEDAFDEWHAARERLLLLTDRYARLRGITPNAAARELEDMAQQMVEFRMGRAGWYPPWDPEAAIERPRDAAATAIIARLDRSFAVADAPPDVGNADSGAEDPVAARTAPRGYRKGLAEHGEADDDEVQDHPGDSR